MWWQSNFRIKNHVPLIRAFFIFFLFRLTVYPNIKSSHSLLLLSCLIYFQFRVAMSSPRLVQRPSPFFSTLPFSLGTTVVCYKLNIAPAFSRDLMSHVASLMPAATAKPSPPLCWFGLFGLLKQLGWAHEPKSQLPPLNKIKIINMSRNATCRVRPRKSMCIPSSLILVRPQGVEGG